MQISFMENERDTLDNFVLPAGDNDREEGGRGGDLRLTNSGGVDDGRQALEVVDDAVVEQLHVGRPQGLHDLVPRQIARCPIQLGHHPVRQFSLKIILTA